MADAPAPQIPMAKVRRILRTPGQQPLTGFPRPAGMDEARAALDEPEAPVHGPERPRDAALGLFKNRRAHFDAGTGR